MNRAAVATATAAVTIAAVPLLLLGADSHVRTETTASGWSDATATSGLSRSPSRPSRSKRPPVSKSPNRPETKRLQPPQVAAGRRATPKRRSYKTGVWDRLAYCESTNRWNYNGSSGYDGGLQFAPSTWRAYGGTQYAPFAWQATREQQITVAKRVLAGQGWGAWPHCSRKLGLR